MNDEIDIAQLGQLGSRLGSGGQADVYLAPDLTLPDLAGQAVFKRYKGNQVSPNGLRAIVGVRSRLDDTNRAILDTLAAWPARVVRDAGAVCGVVMPLIPDSFFQERTLPTGRRTRDPREVQNLFVDPSIAERLGMPTPNLSQRFAVCRDLAAAITLLHKHGVVFGDLNAKNELFRLHPAPTLMLVDCDAVRIRGSAPVVRQLNAPDWAPPEGTVLSQATDLYKYGLFVLRTLSPGPQASTASDPRRVFDTLDAEGRALLAQALSATARDRPPAATWRSYFAKRSTPARAVTPANGRAPSVPVVAATTPTAGWRRDPQTGRWVPRTTSTTDGRRGATGGEPR